jgi:hypothetical protein
MPEDIKFENSLLYYWLRNLVGTSIAFSLNLFVTLSSGLLYSFKVIPSPYLLLIFGVISPIIFTVCLYYFIKNSSGFLLNEPLPKAFLSRSGNSLLMAFDILLIIGFSLLIYFGPLNYFLFRFLQTIFFPGMLLVFLRVLYINRLIEKSDWNNENS